MDERSSPIPQDGSFGTGPGKGISGPLDASAAFGAGRAYRGGIGASYISTGPAPARGAFIPVAPGADVAQATYVAATGRSYAYASDADVRISPLVRFPDLRKQCSLVSGTLFSDSPGGIEIIALKCLHGLSGEGEGGAC